jgi:hypothetical protein
MFRRLLCLAACVALTGCVTEAEMARTAPAGPPAYKDGYVPGCESAAHAAGDIAFKFSKDFDRYLSDAMYKQGWDDGFRVCTAQYSRLAPTPSA